MPALKLRELGVGLGDLLFELNRRAVPELGGFAEIGGALGDHDRRRIRVAAHLVPARPQGGAPFGELSELALERR